MDRKWKSGAALAAPAAADNASDGYPTAGNPGTGVPATKPGPYWYYMITEELLALLTQAGIAFDKAVLTQVRDAVIAIANAAASAASFAAGTKMVFNQTAAPTGWTKEVVHNNKAMRLVTGAVGTGGADAFTSVFGAGKSTSNFTLTTAHIPPHPHNYPGAAGGGSSGAQTDSGALQNNAVTSTDGGSGGAHAHALTLLDLQYVDMIIATKN